MTAQMSNGSTNGASTSFQGVSLKDLPKSNVFTSKLPADPAFPTPADSHKAPRQALGPRMVQGALFTYVRPEEVEKSELLGVSPSAMRDVGLAKGEEKTEEFQKLVAGNFRIAWDENSGNGVYPWAQCYGGWQFGSWARQLGDGRAISLFETTNPSSKVRYELQLKGAGRTPYSRFADGKAVLRSSIREYIVSEALNALHIPSTRALSLTLLPDSRVRRERLEPGAIVARFAQSWLRIGTFDLPHSRGDRALTRKLATYVAEELYGGFDSLRPALTSKDSTEATRIPSSTLEGSDSTTANRFTRLYFSIVRANALTVAKWQAYGFMNGVLNTDNTSLLGLSLDFGPFAFMDDFDPNYTPNHDDGSLRYSYRNQPTIIWWNLVRLGEDFGELMGAGERVDEKTFVEGGVEEDFAPKLIARAEKLIDLAGEEYKSVFLTEYKRLMTARIGLKECKPGDFEELYSELLDTLEALELDFNSFFRKLSTVTLADISSEEKKRHAAGRFFHHEGVTGNEDTARGKVAAWLERWEKRALEDWGQDGDAERQAAMNKVNPKFTPRSWILDEVIDRVEKKGERDVLQRVMDMALSPFSETWEGDVVEQERWCGDVPRLARAMQCSCSS